tara:strand:- start:423 stop:836 length:414 start_codon:yes stop_codon:yes gene_type:complete
MAKKYYTNYGGREVELTPKEFRYKPKTMYGLTADEMRKMTMDEIIEAKDKWDSRDQVKHGYREGYEEAIKLLKERVPVAEVAKKTGKSVNTINSWRRETDIPKLTPEERRKRLADDSGRLWKYHENALRLAKGRRKK